MGGGGEKLPRSFFGNVKGISHFINLREIVWEHVDWIPVAQDR